MRRSTRRRVGDAGRGPKQAEPAQDVRDARVVDGGAPAPRELVERVEQKNAELAEKNATVQSYLAKVVSASEERSRVEGALREANGKANAFDAAKARMEQEATLLQQHNEWLRAMVFHHEYIIAFYLGVSELRHFTFLVGPKFTNFYNVYTRYETQQFVSQWADHTEEAQMQCEGDNLVRHVKLSLIHI